MISILALSVLTATTPLFDHAQDAQSLNARVQAPADYARVSLEAGSFGAFLRTLPLKKVGAKVVSFKGDPIRAPAKAVVDIDIGTSDLQQCADSIIRLHAEYLLASKRESEISYAFTSGDSYRFREHLMGVRPVIKKRVSFAQKAAPVRCAGKQSSAACRATFSKYLRTVFMYAGTLSIARDAKRVKLKNIAPGDFFVRGGSPGHAILVLDIAQNAKGQKLALLGQGFMPAQSFHVIEGPRAGWFVVEESMQTPSWPEPFSGQDLRRF